MPRCVTDLNKKTIGLLVDETNKRGVRYLINRSLKYVSKGINNGYYSTT
jgi:hypothetical protein